MSTLQGLKETLLGGDDNAEYEYECKACNAQFTDSDPNTQRVSCPQCGGHRIKEPLSSVV